MSDDKFDNEEGLRSPMKLVDVEGKDYPSLYGLYPVLMIRADGPLVGVFLDGMPMGILDSIEFERHNDTFPKAKIRLINYDEQTAKNVETMRKIPWLQVEEIPESEWSTRLRSSDEVQLSQSAEAANTLANERYADYKHGFLAGAKDKPDFSNLAPEPKHRGWFELGMKDGRAAFHAAAKGIANDLGLVPTQATSGEVDDPALRALFLAP